MKNHTSVDRYIGLVTETDVMCEQCLLYNLIWVIALYETAGN